MNATNTPVKKRFDYTLMIVPFLVFTLIGATFFIWPDGSSNAIYMIRELINNYFSFWICFVGLGSVAITLVFAFSPLGRIRLGDRRQAMPRFRWGAIVFTTVMGADLLFFSLIEWTYYVDDPYLGTLGGVPQDWIHTLSLFHWGPTVWSFLLVFAAIFGFMIHVRKRETRKLSEACRPLFGHHMDGIWGRVLDILTIISIIAGIATSFSVTAPIIGAVLGRLFGFDAGRGTYIAIIVVLCVVYTISACVGMKSISWFSKLCVWLFLALLTFVFLFSGRAIFMLETFMTSLGNLATNFLRLSTQLDPLRQTLFPQNWTIFYWAYWLSWAVGAPFFIAQISGGRTLRQVIVEGYAWGVAGSWIGFMILGNYGMSLQLIDGMPLSAAVMAGEPTEAVAMTILETLPLSKLVMLVVALVMALLLSTSLDSTTLITGAFCQRGLKPDELPDRRLRVFWGILLIVLPVGLLFAENSLNNLQSIAIIGALPVSVIMILAIIAFVKDARAYLRSGGPEPHEMTDPETVEAAGDPE